MMVEKRVGKDKKIYPWHHHHHFRRGVGFYLWEIVVVHVILFVENQLIRNRVVAPVEILKILQLQNFCLFEIINFLYKEQTILL